MTEQGFWVTEGAAGEEGLWKNKKPPRVSPHWERNSGGLAAAAAYFSLLMVKCIGKVTLPCFSM